MSELQTTPRLSLFQIESELLQLIDQREDALERLSKALGGADPEIEAEIATVNALIKEYVGREVRKVDGIAYAVKEYEARAVAKYAESGRLHNAALKDDETAKRIKQMVLEVMQEFGEKKLLGRLFTITRQGNGGVQALTIAQPDLVPLDMQCVTIELAADELEDFISQFDGSYRIVNGAHPDTVAIREELVHGEGVPGCRLEERGEHIRIK